MARDFRKMVADYLGLTLSNYNVIHKKAKAQTLFAQEGQQIQLRTEWVKTCRIKIAESAQDLDAILNFLLIGKSSFSNKAFFAVVLTAFVQGIHAETDYEAYSKLKTFFQDHPNEKVFSGMTIRHDIITANADVLQQRLDALAVQNLAPIQENNAIESNPADVVQDKPKKAARKQQGKAGVHETTKKALPPTNKTKKAERRTPTQATTKSKAVKRKAPTRTATSKKQNTRKK